MTKVWCKNEDYWTVNYDLLESVKTAFDTNGISIPFNQLDVHVKNDAPAQISAPEKEIKNEAAVQE